MVNSADVIVVGLGAMGGAIAHHLALRGASVIGLDRFDPPHDRGSSHGESRIIREAYFESEVYVPLVRRAYELWGELENAVGGVLLQRTGALLVGTPESWIIQGATRSAALHDIPIDTLTAKDLARSYPMFRVPDAMVGVVERRAGVLDPEGCVAAHLVRAEELGATLRTDEQVIDWREEGNSVEVRTERASYLAGSVIVAAGQWVRDLVPQVDVEIERQVMLWFSPRFAAASLGPEHCPVFLFETAAGTFYGVPDLGGGVKAARHHGGEISSADSIGPHLSEEDVTPVVGFLDEHVPAAAGELRRGVVCRYTNTPDRKFLIDRLPGRERVWVVSACSGHGFKFASAIGEATADLVLEGRRHPTLEPFRWRDQAPATL